MNEQNKNTKKANNLRKWVKPIALIYGILGVFLALSPWYPFRVVVTETITKEFTGLQMSGNFALTYSAIGFIALLTGLSYLTRKPAPRYVPILLSLTALLLTGFFFLLIRQLGPTIDGQHYALISDGAVWNQIKNMAPHSAWGRGWLLAAFCSAAMSLLSLVLLKRPPLSSAKNSA